MTPTKANTLKLTVEKLVARFNHDGIMSTVVAQPPKVEHESPEYDVIEIEVDKYICIYARQSKSGEIADLFLLGGTDGSETGLLRLLVALEQLVQAVDMSISRTQKTVLSSKLGLRGKNPDIKNLDAKASLNGFEYSIGRSSVAPIFLSIKAATHA